MANQPPFCKLRPPDGGEFSELSLGSWNARFLPAGVPMVNPLGLARNELADLPGVHAVASSNLVAPTNQFRVRHDIRGVHPKIATVSSRFTVRARTIKIQNPNGEVAGESLKWRDSSGLALGERPA